MTGIHLSRDYDVEATQIWNRIEDFFAIHEWLPVVESTERDENRPDVRHVVQVGGARLEEQLVAQSAEERSVRYRIIGGDSPFHEFEGLIVVHDGAEPGRATVTWDVVFQSPVPEEEIIPVLRTALETGLGELGMPGGVDRVH